MLFVPVHSLSRNQVLAEGHVAKVAGRKGMIIGINYQWTLAIEQILSLAVVSLYVVSSRSRSQQLQGSCSSPEAQVKTSSDSMKV